MKNAKSLKLQIDEIENLIRAGKHSSAKSQINTVSISQTPREFAIQLANLSRRTGLYLTAIRFLRKYVRNPEKLQIDKPSPSELAEYGASLTAIGARDEANSIFKEISPEHEPQVLLFRSFNLFSKWKYQEAVELLKTYTDLVSDDPYKYAVGRLNYCAALVSAEEYSAAIQELGQLYEFCRTNNFDLLKGHIIQLQAMGYLGLKNYDEAISVIKPEFNRLKDLKSTQSFLVRKWMSLAKIYNGQTKNPKAELTALIEDSLKVKHWESYRDLSMRSSIFNKAKKDFFRVYFGTPYDSFRLGAKEQAPEAWKIPQSFSFGKNHSKATTIDWNTGQSNNSKFELKTGGILHTCFQALSRDQYRPSPLGSLFSHLYPEDYFDPNSSPNRVSQAIYRLRSWTKENNLNYLIQEKKGYYQLQPSSNTGIIFHDQTRRLSKNELILEEIKKSFANQSFTKNDVIPKYFNNAMTFSRWSRWAIDSGFLSKEGHTRSIKYQILLQNAA